MIDKNDAGTQLQLAKGSAAGPLMVSAANPRYFTIASGKAAEGRVVYLTGSHIWNNFHDGMGPGSDCADTPEQFDYEAYLDFLKERGHNFIRLWRWEQFKSQAAGGSFHLCMMPQPWPRTAPATAGMAKDGKPKFDLSKFDQAYFDRLRDRVIAAGNRGIYVAVMLFDGWALHLSPAPDNVEGHPFHAANNINRIGITSILDYQVLPLDPRVQALQEAYIRKVVDTVHDLPNVLYEIANESSGGGAAGPEFVEALGLGVGPEGEPPEWGDSTQWQYWAIEFLKQYEREMGYEAHPVGMTMQFPVADQTKVNDPLFNSPADWISPGYDDEIFAKGGHPMEPGGPPSRWFDNPPAGDGRKVVITDTDHYAPGKGDALWAWKSFLRGHNPILMDFGLIGGTPTASRPRTKDVGGRFLGEAQFRPDSSSESPGSPPNDAFDPARYAMGDTLRYAQKMALVEMEPRGDLSSTGYVLANPGREYLILQPSDTAEAFKVELAAGPYAVEWYSVNSRETRDAGRVRVESPTSGSAPGPGLVGFSAPFEPAGPAILYLRRE